MTKFQPDDGVRQERPTMGARVGVAAGQHGWVHAQVRAVQSVTTLMSGNVDLVSEHFFYSGCCNMMCWWSHGAIPYFVGKRWEEPTVAATAEEEPALMQEQLVTENIAEKECY